MLMRPMLLALPLLLLTAPLTAQKHVVFADRDWTDAAQPNGPIQVYIDGWGNLYPGRAVRMDASTLARHGVLERYFQADPRAWDALRSGTGVSQRAFAAGWPRVQDVLRERLVRRINDRATSGGIPQTVVFLIHGFREDDARQGFRRMEQTIRGRYPRRPLLFVHVNWDGFYTPLTHLNTIPATWDSANYSAPLVGLQLRRVIQGVRQDLPIRVITHSLGGGVIASALWPRADIRWQEGLYAEFSRRSAGDAPFLLPPHRDFRLGMLVPAMRGEAFTALAPQNRAGRGNYPLVVVAQNRQDLVVKGANITLKETSLAVDDGVYCKHVHRPFALDPAATAVRVDFAREFGVAASHSIDAYFKRRPIRNFLKLLFEGTLPPGELMGECPA